MLNQPLYTAVVTPFNEHGDEIDFKSLQNILTLQMKAKNGIVLLGSTGETLSLTLQEQKKILQFVDTLKLPNKIIVGVPNYNLATALEWLEYCNTATTIHGYMVAPPMYTRPGFHGQLNWFKKILQHSAHPVMLYDIPARTGVALDPAIITALADHPNLWAIKNASGVPAKVHTYRKAWKQLCIYCGDDNLLASMALQHVAGLVSVVANAIPVETRNTVALALTGQSLPLKWFTISHLIAECNPIPIKHWLCNLGIIKHATVRPPLDTLDFREPERLAEYVNCAESSILA